MPTLNIAAAPSGTYRKVTRLLSSSLGGNAWTYTKADKVFTFVADAEQLQWIKGELEDVEGLVFGEDTTTEAAASTPVSSPARTRPRAPALAPAQQGRFETVDELHAHMADKAARHRGR